MTRRNLAIFFVVYSFFAFFILSKNANAAVPSSVVNQLRDSCRGGTIYQRDFDGSVAKFETYYSGNPSITTNWISSDYEGNRVINSVYEKNDFQVSRENRSFYFNIGFMNCFGSGISGSATNVRIWSNRGDAGILEARPESFGVAGQGSVYNYSSGVRGDTKRIGVFKVSIKESAIANLHDGRIIRFIVNQCAGDNPGSNYPASLEHQPVNDQGVPPGFCYPFEARIRVKAPVKFNVEGSTRAAVINSNQRLNSNDPRFRNNGRNNPQIARVGQWVSFDHKVLAKDFNRNEVAGRGSYYTTRDGATINSNQNFTWRKRGGDGRPILINQGNVSDSVNSTGIEREMIRLTRDMAGKTICSRMHYRLAAGDIDGTNRYNNATNEACVYVPYEFNITPCIQIEKIRNCSGGDLDIPVDGKIPPDPNDGEEIRVPEDGTVTSPVRYKITTWRVSADKENFQTYNSKRDNENSDTCSASNYYYQDYQGIESCRVVKEDNSGKSYNKDTKVADYIPAIEDGVEPGTRYCVALSISPYKMDANQTREQQAQNSRQWRHSAPICIKAVKKPKVQFWGNGVFSKSGIRTSLSSTRHGLFGSWVEFEGISGLKNRDFRTESSQNTRKLAIEDYISTSSFGQGRSSIDSIISNISSRFPRNKVDNANTKVEVFNNTNTKLGSFEADRPTRIVYGKNIRISGNVINADRTVNRDSDFRQIIIIADGDITIDQGVTRVDAWLISRGNINTCAVDGLQNSNNVNTKNCNAQLNIRGGTISNNLRLWRTAGSDGIAKERLTSPAEIINQSADTFLWAQNQSGGEGKIVTTYTKELPVRY